MNSPVQSMASETAFGVFGGDSLSVDMGTGGNGNGQNGGRGWFGRWGGDGKQGGFSDGKWALIAAAWADSAAPRTGNRTVIESETGIKFPLSILLTGDKSPLRFLGGESPKNLALN